MLWLPSPPLYTKSSGKTMDAASVKKALAVCSAIFKPKSRILLACRRTKNHTQLAPRSETFIGGEAIKTIHQLSYSPNIAMADFFLFQSSEVKAGGRFSIPGRLHDERGGSPKPAAKAVCRRLLLVDGLLRTIRSNSHRAGLKKS
jgi:hypothetical protein